MECLRCASTLLYPSHEKPYATVYMQSLLNSENAGLIVDPTLTAIIDEELDHYLEEERSAMETADVLQKRVSIYLAE